MVTCLSIVVYAVNLTLVVYHYHKRSLHTFFTKVQKRGDTTLLLSYIGGWVTSGCHVSRTVLGVKSVPRAAYLVTGLCQMERVHNARSSFWRNDFAG